MTCPSCLRAMQVASHRDYVDGCIGCGVRELAHMPNEKREQAFDVLLKQCGRYALRGERAKERA